MAGVRSCQGGPNGWSRSHSSLALASIIGPRTAGSATVLLGDVDLADDPLQDVRVLSGARPAGDPRAAVVVAAQPVDDIGQSGGLSGCLGLSHWTASGCCAASSRPLAWCAAPP